MQGPLRPVKGFGKAPIDQHDAGSQPSCILCQGNSQSPRTDNTELGS